MKLWLLSFNCDWLYDHDAVFDKYADLVSYLRKVCADYNISIGVIHHSGRDVMIEMYDNESDEIISAEAYKIPHNPILIKEES